MRERPIIFSGPMVRAILDGRKTQTRRVLKQAKGPSLSVDMSDDEPGVAELSWLWGDGPGYDVNETIKRVPCPYGAPGDRLWVREAWAPDPPIDNTWASTQWNGCGRTVSELPERFLHPRFCIYAADWLHGPIRWTPSIHMPRWASRITLEVTGVRVERLQDISSSDAISEGIEPCPRGGEWRNYLDSAPNRDALTPRVSFRSLWESINGVGSWDANPYVWVVSFRRIAT